MKRSLALFLRGASLRRRFLVAPLLGVVVCSALTVAFVYESRRQNDLLTRITEQDLRAFNRYAQVFVNLTAQHTALYALLNGADKLDEQTLYDRAKHHLSEISRSVSELEQSLPAMRKHGESYLAAPRQELTANAHAYRKGVGAAVAMATFNLGRVPSQLAIANTRFTAMNTSFVRLLDLERDGIGFEIASRVRQSRIENTTIALVGVSMAALLLVLSWTLAHVLCRSIEAQVDALTDLGAQAGAPAAAGGGDEVERMSVAIAAFRNLLTDLNASHAQLVEHKGELERRIAETEALSRSNTSLAIDITEMKRIDVMKSEFVSMVSHELRTPLTSIRGSLGLISGGVAGKLPEAATKLVEIAKSNCERLIRLINDILDTERIESGKMRLDLQVVELRPLLSQAIAANEGFAGQHRVSLALDAGGEGVRVNVDIDGLSQVLANLLSNAVKFSPPGGSVDVSLTLAKGLARVEVRDRGPGIPDEFLARIFQKFSQADSSDTRQKGGTGLGLNISKAIVERLGGTIGFDTEAGVGTVFFFALPEWEDKAADLARPASREPDRPYVLVCEDDADIAGLIGMMLENAGYATDIAYTASRAREMAASWPYAAMTVDLELPDLDGMDLIRTLREGAATRHLPIVVVSAHADDGRIQIDSETLSVSDWLGKPIDANRLVLAVRDAVARGAKEPLQTTQRVLDGGPGPPDGSKGAGIAQTA